MEDLLFVAACTQTDETGEAMVKEMIATLATIQEKAAEVSVVRAGDLSTSDSPQPFLGLIEFLKISSSS